MGIRVSEEEEYEGVDISRMRPGGLSGVRPSRGVSSFGRLTPIGAGGDSRPFFCLPDRQFPDGRLGSNNRGEHR